MILLLILSLNMAFVEGIKTTPQKIYPKGQSESPSDKCRLCGNFTDSRYLARVFSNSGKEKDWQRKILQTCGVTIAETDYLPTVICRKCANFVSKMWEFRQQIQGVQMTLKQQFSIKRGIVTSPASYKQPTKRGAFLSKYDDNTRRTLDFNEVYSPHDMQYRTQMNIDINRKPDVTPCVQYVSVQSITPSWQSQIKPKLSSVAPPHPTSVYASNLDTYVTTPLTTVQQAKLERASRTKIPTAIAHIVTEACPSVELAIKRNILHKCKISSDALCKRSSDSSVLYASNEQYKMMKDFSTDRLWQEMMKYHPFLIDLLNAMTGNEVDITNTTDELKVKYSFIYSIIMNIRWHELSLFQRVNTVLLIEGGCGKQLQHRLNRLGVCLSHGRRDTLLNLIGGHFLDQTASKIKSGRTFRGTGDNYDLRILKGHMRKGVQNDDLHLFATNFIENRIDFNHVPNDSPLGDIKTFPRHKFSPSVSEIKKYAECVKVLVGRIVLEFCPKFKFLKTVVPTHIEHEFSETMSQKSFIASMPIIDANESKYQDCVKILRTYEKWIAEIYNKAGLLDNLPNKEDPPIPEGPAAPGQRRAHAMDDQDDPMREMKVVMGGDQLTRVRFAGAKDLLAGAHTPTDRFEHCSPFKPVMWHTKASLLQYSYSLLYKSESVGEQGTLKYFREKYDRHNATPKKVLDCFEGSEELFLSMGRAYIIVAILHFFGMCSVDDKPTIHEFPKNIIHATEEQKKAYFDEVFGSFVQKYILQIDPLNNSDVDDDYVKNYGLCAIFLSILILQMKDTAREADGERNLINQKFLLSVFKSLGSYSKYAIEMFVSIAQIECLLTPRLSQEFKWGFFVNWRGGVGNNIEDDLAQEITNKMSKNIVQRMGPNKSISSINKISKAMSGISMIKEQFDKTVGVAKESVKHTTRDSMKDERDMIEDLIKLDPFNHMEGRSYKDFKDIKRSPLRYLNIVEFHQWLEQHKKEMHN